MRKIISFLVIFYGFGIKAQLCFREPISHPSLGKWSTVTGDFNNDNFQDLASYINNNSIMVLLGNGTGSLTLASTFTVNAANSTHSYNELVARDLNSDGDLDLAVINAGSNSVTLFAGLGNGSFLANGAINTVGSQPVGISSADFNNDGYIDLTVANAGSKTISVLLGVGFGYFNSAINFSVSTGGTPRSITVGDYNSDGKKDLAVGIQTTTSTNKIAIYIGDGLGNFSAGANYSVALTFPNSIETRDFNADGKLDIICNKSSNSFIGVFLGQGNGTFNNEVTYNTQVGQPTNILCGDYNSDGIIDIATGSYATNELAVLLGNGAGGFGTVLKYPAGTNPCAAASADFNNDGKSDIAVGLSAGGINVLLNGPLNVGVTGSLSICSGSSTTLTASGAASYTWSANAGGVTTSTVSISPLSTTIYTITANNGSCTQASKTVTVNVNTTPTVSISGSAFNGCRGSSITFTASGASSYTWSSNANNSNSAIVTVSPTSSTQYNVIGANGQCNSSKFEYVNVIRDYVLSNYTTFNLGSSGKLLTKDFNNDGKLDILQGSSIFLGDGTGNFNLGITIPFNGGAYGVTANDFNNDGHLDVAIAAGNLNTQVSLANSNGLSFLSPITLMGGTLPTMIGSADFNGDSKMDLAVGNSNTNNISIFIGNGNGGFSNAVNYNVAVNAIGSVYMCIDDFNNDGISDIVVPGQILIGTGTGSFLPSQNISAIGFIISEDINNDGNKDIVYASLNQIGVIFGNGDGTFYSGKYYGSGFTGNGLSSLICADINNDGIKDFATTDINSNAVYVTLGNDADFGGSSGQGFPLFATSGYANLTFGDYTGNGKIDLAAGSYAPAGFSVLLNGLDVYADNDSICNKSYFTYQHGSFSGFNNVSLSDPFGGLPLNVPPYTPVTYSITANYSSCNYQETKAFTVIVKPSPTLSLTSTSTLVCLSAPFLNQSQYQAQSIITASGAVNYQFPSSPSSTTNTFVVNNDPNQPFINNTSSVHNETFVIVGTNNEGCSDMDTISLKIIPSFTVAVTSATSCSSVNCTLTAVSPSAVSYTWNTGQQGSPIIVQPQEPTPGVPQSFAATGINAYGCSSVLNSPGSVVQLFPNQLTNFAYTTNSLSVTFSMSNPNYCNSTGFLWDYGNGGQNTLSSNPSTTYQPGLYTACLRCGNNVPQECVACTTFSLPSNTSGGTDVSVFEYQNASLGIKYYPNPTNGNFTIETENETTISITNILGETILSQKLQQGKNEINLYNQASGVYFIKNNNSTLKIIKQ